jgi:hypothetical protein
MKRQETLTICREALRRGQLVLKGQAWMFGRRGFSFAAVARLIEAGEAVREGNIVRAT